MSGKKNLALVYIIHEQVGKKSGGAEQCPDKIDERGVEPCQSPVSPWKIQSKGGEAANIYAVTRCGGKCFQYELTVFNTMSIIRFNLGVCALGFSGYFVYFLAGGGRGGICRRHTITGLPITL